MELSRSPDPERVRTRSELAEALKVLRTTAGLTVRALAELLGSGKHLHGPGQAKAFRAVLEACGITDRSAAKLATLDVTVPACPRACSE